MAQHSREGAAGGIAHVSTASSILNHWLRERGTMTKSLFEDEMERSGIDMKSRPRSMTLSKFLETVPCNDDSFVFHYDSQFQMISKKPRTTKSLPPPMQVLDNAPTSLSCNYSNHDMASTSSPHPHTRNDVSSDSNCAYATDREIVDAIIEELLASPNGCLVLDMLLEQIDEKLFLSEDVKRQFTNRIRSYIESKLLPAIFNECEEIVYSTAKLADGNGVPAESIISEEYPSSGCENLGSMEQAAAQMKSLGLYDGTITDKMAKTKDCRGTVKSTKAEVEYAFGKEDGVRQLHLLVYILKVAEAKLMEESNGATGCPVLKWADAIDKCVGGSYYYFEHGLINFHCLLRKKFIIPIEEGSRNFILDPNVSKCKLAVLNYALEQDIHNILLGAYDYTMTFDELTEALMKIPKYRETCIRLTQKQWNNSFAIIAKTHDEVFRASINSTTVKPSLQLVGIDDVFIIHVFNQ